MLCKPHYDSTGRSKVEGENVILAQVLFGINICMNLAI